MSDTKHMRRALALARKAWGHTSPNPMVGAVIVKGGAVIAEGWHKRAGMPHAEAEALALAGPKAAGADMYVTLEPCCHKNKRTPPCANAIIEAGIKRVFVAHEDPNPNVRGKGVAMLREAGIKVETGMLAAQAAELNEAYIKFITTGRPFVILKAAMTLDGRIATPEGQSKWITGPAARRLVHRTRAGVDAIVTAIGTVRADDPEMTARIKGAKSPARVVIDPRLEIDEGARILNGPPATIVVTGRADSPKAQRLATRGVQIMAAPSDDVPMSWVIESLVARGVCSVMIEGGASLNWRALNEGVVDRVMFFVAPKVIGGSASMPVVGGGTAFRPLESAITLEGFRARKVGGDLLIEGRPL